MATFVDYSKVFEIVPAPLAVLTSSFTIEAANLSFRRLTGEINGSVTGRSCPEILPHIIGQAFLECGVAVRASLEKVMSTGLADTIYFQPSLQNIRLQEVPSNFSGWRIINMPLLNQENQVCAILLSLSELSPKLPDDILPQPPAIKSLQCAGVLIEEDANQSAAFSNSSNQSALLIAPGTRTAREESLKILVVEDNNDFRELLCEMLGLLGHNAISEISGEQGLDAITKHDLDLLITDVTLPGLSGVELAKKAHLLKPNLKIILSSGYNLSASTQLNFKVSLLPKPYNLNQLVQILEETMYSMQ